MYREAVSRALSHFNMKGVYKIIPKKIVGYLASKLDIMFVYQSSDNIANKSLVNNPTSTAFTLHHSTA